MSESEADACSRDEQIAELRKQLAVLADFVETVIASLIPNSQLTALLVENLLTQDDHHPRLPEGSRRVPPITIAKLAHNVLAIAGRLPMPSAVRLVHSVEDRVENGDG